jgi:hypothetical protein
MTLPVVDAVKPHVSYNWITEVRKGKRTNKMGEVVAGKGGRGQTGIADMY